MTDAFTPQDWPRSGRFLTRLSKVQESARTARGDVSEMLRLASDARWAGNDLVDLDIQLTDLLDKAEQIHDSVVEQRKAARDNG